MRYAHPAGQRSVPAAPNSRAEKIRASTARVSQTLTPIGFASTTLHPQPFACANFLDSCLQPTLLEKASSGSLRMSTLIEPEGYLDADLNRYRNAILKRGFKFPSANGFHGLFVQTHAESALHVYVMGAAVGPHHEP